MRAAALALYALALAGCAAAPPAADEPRRPRPIESYAADPFVPVNLYLNANEHLAAEHAALVEHAAQRLRASKAFERLDRGVQRWPITLQASLRVQAAVPTWRTRLGLDPATRTYTLVAEIFEEPDHVAAVELVAQSQASGREAVDALLEQLLAEIAQRKLVPRWAAFKPPPPEKKKPKIPGRAT